MRSAAMRAKIEAAFGPIDSYSVYGDTTRWRVVATGLNYAVKDLTPELIRQLVSEQPS